LELNKSGASLNKRKAGKQMHEGYLLELSCMYVLNILPMNRLKVKFSEIPNTQ